MFVRIKVCNNIIDIPFSEKHIANSFVRGFNGTSDAFFSQKEYPCSNNHEQRGARFFENLYRYYAKHGIDYKPVRLEVDDIQKNKESLFDDWG